MILVDRTAREIISKRALFLIPLIGNRIQLDPSSTGVPEGGIRMEFA